MSTLHVINGSAALSTSRIQFNRLTANADTLPSFDGSYRCLKEINYPRSFSSLSSSVIGLPSTPTCTTSVRVQSQRSLPHSSRLLPRLSSRLFLQHRYTVMPQVTTRDVFNPFSQSCRRVLVYSRSILYRTDASFLRNRPPRARAYWVHSTEFPSPRFSPSFRRPENGDDPDKVI